MDIAWLSRNITLSVKVKTRSLIQGADRLAERMFSTYMKRFWVWDGQLTTQIPSPLPHRRQIWKPSYTTFSASCEVLWDMHLFLQRTCCSVKTRRSACWRVRGSETGDLIAWAGQEAGTGPRAEASWAPFALGESFRSLLFLFDLFCFKHFIIVIKTIRL